MKRTRERRELAIGQIWRHWCGRETFWGIVAIERFAESANVVLEQLDLMHEPFPEPRRKQQKATQLRAGRRWRLVTSTDTNQETP